MNTLLTVNGGSSSLKCALYHSHADGLRCLYRFKLGNILGQARFSVRNQAGEQLVDKQALDFDTIAPEQRHQACLQQILDWLQQHAPGHQLQAIGHRVVHGGEAFSHPVRISAAVLDQLRALMPLAPLHQPYNLKLIEACQALAPALPQIACFDTMFHRTQPEIERNYALPRALSEAGIHRYGFHGLSYEYIQRQLEQQGCGGLNSVVCHLGAGASMCAIREGRAIASSMGFTAVEGLPMGSRCGNIDPGVLLYLQRQYQMDVDALERLLNKESGWYGVSGISSDMLELHRACHPHAEEAIDMFCYRAALEIGRLSAALQGLEQIVFTGGVGENDADVRQRILRRCQWLGVSLCGEANQAGKRLISTQDATVKVQVIPTDEEAMIATHVLELLD